MKPGDLVKVNEIFDGDLGKNEDEIGIYEDWKNLESKKGGFLNREIGMILDSYLPQGGNGIKILSSSGKIGWVNSYYFEVIQ